MTSKNQKLNKFRHSYTVAINSHPQRSWVNATIIDRKNIREATVDFHLYTQGRSMYAECRVPEHYKWVGEDIDTISPVVCEAAINANGVKITWVQANNGTQRNQITVVGAAKPDKEWIPPERRILDNGYQYRAIL